MADTDAAAAAMIHRLSGERPGAVLLVDGSGSHGLAFARSLGRKGTPVVVLNKLRGPGGFSRYALNVDLPREMAPEALLELLIRVGRAMKTKPALLSSSDQHTLFMARNRDVLSEHFAFVVPDTELAERIGNKRTQYATAEAAGFKVPKTIAFSTPEQVERAAIEIGFPCALKPAYSDLWRDYRRRQNKLGPFKLAMVKNMAELRNAYGVMAESGLEFLLQEFIPGADDQIYSIYSYHDRSSSPLAAIVRRRLRQWPVGQGNGCYVTSVRDPELKQSVLQVLSEMNYTGLANVELKRDPRDGMHKLMEINLRSGNGVGLALDLGVDLPYFAYCDALGLPIEPKFDHVADLRWVELAGDAQSFLYSWRQGKIGLAAWLVSIMQARSYAYFALDDPKPSLARIVEIVSGATSQLWQWIRPRFGFSS